MRAPSRQDYRLRSKSRQRLSPLVLLLATLAAAAVLVPIVAVPQWLSTQARWEQLRMRVGEIAQLAASVVDGDLHRRLLDPANYSEELYEQALKPLARFHSANPSIFYVYTMMERDGAAYFILDTAASPELKTPHSLKASAYMERFELRKDYEDDGWLTRIAAGETYVNPTFEQDEYGTFLSGHAPIHDSAGRYSGFVGVDFDTGYYVAQEAKFRSIALGSLAAALISAVGAGFVVAMYQASVRRRMQELHEASIRDGLTGLLNRRGVVDAVKEASAKGGEVCALLLIDVDNLKIINDTRGHVMGDAVIALAAEAIRESIGKDDVCGRFGGDEFLIFAPDCDPGAANALAQAILAKLNARGMQLAGIRFTLSVGIAVHPLADADFFAMYRNADAALLQARSEGKSRIGMILAGTGADKKA